MKTPIRTAGATLALAALFAAGAAVPAQAVPGCIWPNANGVTVVTGQEQICAKPNFLVAQNNPATVGTLVLISGRGFEPGETVNIIDRYGKYNMVTTATADGSIRIEWAVPDYSRMAFINLSARGTVSNYETESYQVRQEPAMVDRIGFGALVGGWYPGEELIITVDDQPRPSRYASATGTSDAFEDIKGGYVRVYGKQSGGVFSFRSLGDPTGNITQPPVTTEPEVPVEEVPNPVVEEVPVPVLTLDVPVPEVAAPAPVVLTPKPAAPVPAPLRPQPQAGVSLVEAEAANVGTAITVGTGVVLFGSLAAFLGIRRLRTFKHVAR